MYNPLVKFEHRALQSNHKKYSDIYEVYDFVFFEGYQKYPEIALKF